MRGRKSVRKVFDSAAKPAQVSYNRECKVSVIRLHGGIGTDDNISYDRFESLIVEAFAWKQASAVVLDIDCPGGEPAETELIAREIRRQADFFNKPVYAFVKGHAASGGYWLACAADRIFALPTSTVGSVGVLMQGLGYHKKNEREGIERRVFTAGKHKSQLDEHQPLKKRDIAKVQEALNDIHAEFKSWVKERRGDRLKGSDSKLLTGDFWKGRRAAELGLIDGIGDMKDVIPGLMKARVMLKVFSPPPLVLESAEQDQAGYAKSTFQRNFSLLERLPVARI